MRKRDPRTKEELLDRMLSFDFDGDIRHLGVEAASVVRTGANRLELTFPWSGVTFELEVHRPREYARSQAKAEPRTFSAPRDDGLQRIAADQEPEPEAAPRPRVRRQQPQRREG